MSKKLFLSSLIFLFSILFSGGLNIINAQTLICKVSFCSCCRDTGVSCDLYDITGSHLGSFTTDSTGCNYGQNLTQGASYYVVVNCHHTSLPPVYFTGCVCQNGTQTVMLPCCPNGDNPNSQNFPNSNIPPKVFALHQNYPNPFNPTTKIQFDIPIEGNVKLAVFDIAGREIETLVNGIMAVGYHEVTWDAKNVASGVYFYKIETSTFTDEKKMVVIK